MRCAVHWLPTQDELDAAAKVVADSSREDLQHQDTDERWRRVSLVGPKTHRRGDAQTAYRAVRSAAIPANIYYRAEYHFPMAGWIALRFPIIRPLRSIILSTSMKVLPIQLCWHVLLIGRGHAAEAAGQLQDMRAQYETAARYPTAYYARPARARLGLRDIALPPPPPQPIDGAKRDLLHGADILYAIGEFDLALSFVSDLAETSSDVATLSGLGQLAVRYNDAQAMLAIGKTALARGMPFKHYALPEIESRLTVRSLLRSIKASSIRSYGRRALLTNADKSPANAVGLSRLHPRLAAIPQKRFGVSYDWKRLVSDPVYNMQMGEAGDQRSDQGVHWLLHHDIRGLQMQVAVA